MITIVLAYILPGSVLLALLSVIVYLAVRRDIRRGVGQGHAGATEAYGDELARMRVDNHAAKTLYLLPSQRGRDV